MNLKKIITITIVSLLGVYGMTAQDDNKTKTVVVYFSATGTTAAQAKNAAAALGADIIEIEPVHKYTSADLNWHDRKSLTTIECNDPKSRPAIAKKIDISGYDTVILYYPIWWGYAPKIVYTFVESQKWSGKSMIALCTSGGSGLGRSGSDLAKFANGVSYKGGKDCTRSGGESVRQYIEGLLNK